MRTAAVLMPLVLLSAVSGAFAQEEDPRFDSEQPAEPANPPTQAEPQQQETEETPDPPYAAPGPDVAPEPAEPAVPEPTYAISAPPPDHAAATGDGGGGFTMLPFSVRVDPLNWLLLGRFGLELEVALLNWLTVESVPIFVVNEKPVLLHDDISQSSNGLGPIAGASLGVGFWLDKVAFRGTVLRAGITNYSHRYTTEYSLSSGTVDSDSLTHTQRRLSFMIGSHVVWGFFTIAGGIGLEYELNRQTRCFEPNGSPTTSGCRDNQLLLRTSPPDQSLEAVNVHGSLYPYDIVGRISLGVVID